MLEAVHQTGHASRHGHLRIRDAVAHGVANSYLYRDSRFFRQFHYLVDKRNHEAVKVRSRNVLEVTSRHQTRVQGLLYGLQIIVGGLTPCHVHLLEYVIVAARHENTRFLDFQIPNELKILFFRPYPRGYLREFQPQLHTFGNGLSVLFRIYEKLRLADYAVRPAESGQKSIKIHDLLYCIRGHGLLAVSERCVGNPYVRRHVYRHASVVESYLGDLFVVENIPEQVGLFHILQSIFVYGLFQQVGFFGKFEHVFTSFSVDIKCFRSLDGCKRYA